MFPTDPHAADEPITVAEIFDGQKVPVTVAAVPRRECLIGQNQAQEHRTGC